MIIIINILFFYAMLRISLRMETETDDTNDSCFEFSRLINWLLENSNKFFFSLLILGIFDFFKLRVEYPSHRK